MVAHNASFDRGFWLRERTLAGYADDADSASEGDGVAGGAAAFGCTMRLSRRLYPEAPNHRLGTLAEWLGIESSGRAHRALADAEVAAQLWLRIVRDAERRWDLPTVRASSAWWRCRTGAASASSAGWRQRCRPAQARRSPPA